MAKRFGSRIGVERPGWFVYTSLVVVIVASLFPLYWSLLIGVLGISYEEAAEICGCAMGTIKSRLNRARATLVAELGEESARSSVQSIDPFPLAPAMSLRHHI